MDRSTQIGEQPEKGGRAINRATTMGATATDA
jgi:hypothetical protein